MVMYSVNNEVANMLTNKQLLASTAPAIVTTRQPYLFTKILATGPVNIHKKNENISVKRLFF